MTFSVRSKKGFLLASEVLKIVLAVIGTGILIYLLTAIYFSNIDDENLELAKSTTERIDIVVRDVTSGNKVQNVTGLVPVDWWVFYFTQGEPKPNSCAGVECLCICNRINLVSGIFSSQILECDDLGSCSIIPDLKDEKDFEIEAGANNSGIVFRKDGKWMEAKRI